MKQSLRTAAVVLVILLLFALPLALASAVGASAPEAVWLEAPGWSRARLVATTALDEPVPVAVDPDGGAYLLVVHAEGAQRQPRVVALDARAQVRWEHAFPAPPAPPRDLQMVWDGQGLALFWISGRELYGARIDAQGAAPTEPQVISGQVSAVSYSVAASGPGRGAVWFSGTDATPGLFAVPLDDLGRPPERVEGAGRQPSIRFDESGALHAIWLADAAADSVEIWYGAYEPSGAARVRQPVARIDGVGPSLSVQGPWLGIDQAHTYVLWSTLITGGRNAGASLAHYVSFPAGQPAQASAAQLLTVPRGEGLAYTSLPPAGLLAGPRVPIAGLTPAQGQVPTELSVSALPGPELAVAVTSSNAVRQGQTRSQVGTLFLQGGAPVSYQRLSVGQRSALTPALAADQGRHLYVTWREVSARGSVVYFAGTAPGLRAALSELSTDDVLRITSDVIFGMIAGVVVAPLTMLLWFVPPMVVLLATWVVRRRSARWGALASIALALAAYWGAKLLILGQMRDYVPFSAWVPIIPPWLALPLQLGVPLLVAGLALAAAWGYTYRRGQPSAPLFVVIYAVIDSLCTMALYGEQLVAG